jgi:signal transduction histidine kinase
MALRTPIQPGGCAAALEQYVEHWRQQSGLEAEVEIAANLNSLSPLVELQVLRIVQEALTNVRKHAGAERSWVTCVETDGRVVLEVRDDGSGFDPEARQRSEMPRFGLAIMRERAESIGATFAIESAVGQGTRVRMELPKTPWSP